MNIYQGLIYFLKITSCLGALLVCYLLYNISISSKESTALPKIDSSLTATVPTKKEKKITNYEMLIKNFNFEGMGENSPYNINADLAVKLAENKYELDKVNGSYMVNNELMLVEAGRGIVNEITKKMNLKKAVSLIYKDIIFNTEDIDIDLNTYYLKSNSHVKLMYKNSEINADGFESTGGGDLIKFKGHVITNIHLPTSRHGDEIF